MLTKVSMYIIHQSGCNSIFQQTPLRSTLWETFLKTEKTIAKQIQAYRVANMLIII